MIASGGVHQLYGYPKEGVYIVPGPYSQLDIEFRMGMPVQGTDITNIRMTRGAHQKVM